jgi:hypothetical protein
MHAADTTRRTPRAPRHHTPGSSTTAGGALRFRVVATAPSVDVELASVNGEARPFGNWLTTFPLVLAVVDPYTHESAWILRTVQRIFENYGGGDCRVAFLATADAAGTKQFLGSLADDFLAFADPDRAVVKSLGLGVLPALVVVRQDGSLLGAAEGWVPEEWRALCEDLTRLTSWSRPNIPATGDPGAYPGTPALG